MICSQVTVSSQPVLKELVTNLTDNENIINGVLWVSEGINRPTFVKKYQEGNNWVFQYQMPETVYVALGADGGLAKFIAANFKTIAVLLLALAGVTVVWLWRDVQTKREEVKATLSDNATNAITQCLNSNLPNDQKQKCIESVLKGVNPPTDWGKIILPAVGLLAAAYLIGEFVKGGK